jgi:hypothetical protein
LRHETDLAAAHAAHLLFPQTDQVVPLKLDFARNIAAAVTQQSQDGQSQRALARSAFSHQTENLAGLDIEAGVAQHSRFARVTCRKTHRKQRIVPVHRTFLATCGVPKTRVSAFQ